MKIDAFPVTEKESGRTLSKFAVEVSPGSIYFFPQEGADVDPGVSVRYMGADYLVKTRDALNGVMAHNLVGAFAENYSSPYLTSSLGINKSPLGLFQTWPSSRPLINTTINEAKASLRAKPDISEPEKDYAINLLDGVATASTAEGAWQAFRQFCAEYKNEVAVVGALAPTLIQLLAM